VVRTLSGSVYVNRSILRLITLYSAFVYLKIFTSFSPKHPYFWGGVHELGQIISKYVIKSLTKPNKFLILVSGKLSTNLYVINICVFLLLKLWLQMTVLAVACYQLSCTFFSPGSGAVKRFVITASVNQVTTADIWKQLSD